MASYSTTSSCQIIRELRQMFMFAKINGYLKEDPSVTMPHVKNTRSQRLPDIFTSEEINKILEVIDRNDPLGKRDYAIVITTVRLGLRSCDVISLNLVQWIGLKRRSILYRKNRCAADLAASR